MKKKYIRTHKKAKDQSITSPSDIYRGTFDLFNDGNKKLDLIIFSLES